MFLLSTNLQLKSPFSLERTAEIISEHIFAGVKFVGREEFIYDEVPAIYGEKEVFGFRLILQGEGDDEGFFLELWSTFERSKDMSLEAVETRGVKVNDYVRWLLNDIPEIQLVGISNNSQRNAKGLFRED